MSSGNLHIRYASVPYGSVSELLPVETLSPAAYWQHDSAAERIQSASDSEIVAIAPESMATGYRLGQHPLTAIDLDSLSEARYERLDEGTRSELRGHSILVLGQFPDHENRTLREFA